MIDYKMAKEPRISSQLPSQLQFWKCALNEAHPCSAHRELPMALSTERGLLTRAWGAAPSPVDAARYSSSAGSLPRFWTSAQTRPSPWPEGPRAPGTTFSARLHCLRFPKHPAASGRSKQSSQGRDAGALQPHGRAQLLH